MVIHDFICWTCGRILQDSAEREECCGTPMDYHWHAKRLVSVHPKERTVIWYNPATGRHATPGRNDVPMPDRYRVLGYERREFPTLRDLDSYCKSHNVVNEKAHYDSNGRGYDDEA